MINNDKNDIDEENLLQQTIDSFLRALKENADVRIIVAIYGLLAVWLTNKSSTSCVKESLSNGAFVQTLIEQISRSTEADSIKQSLATFLLGILYISCSGNDESFKTTRYCVDLMCPEKCFTIS